MSELIKTLHKKGDASVEIYPNIKAENIPDGSIDYIKLKQYAVTTDKIANSGVTNIKINNGAVTSEKIANSSITTDKINDSAVTTLKISDDAVTTDKIDDSAVTTDKIANSSVTTNKIKNGAVTLQKLDDDIINTLLRLQYCYNLYIGDSDSNVMALYRTTTLSNRINDYSASEISSALDFDKASSSDYTNSDLAILKMIIDGFNEDINVGTNIDALAIGGFQFQMVHFMGNYEIDVYENGVQIFQLKFDDTTLNIVNYVNTKYIYLYLSRLINPNVTYE